MDQENKTNLEVIPVAYPIAIQRGVHPYVAVCSTYGSALQHGLRGTNAVNAAVDAAVANGGDFNASTVAAALAAMKWGAFSYPGLEIAEDSGFNSLDCSASPSSGAEKFKYALKCKCNMTAFSFAAVNQQSIYYNYYGKSGDDFIKNIMDTAKWRGASDQSSVCAGYYVGEYLLGMWYSTIIDKVANNANFACIDQTVARNEATSLAQAEHHLSSP